MYCYGSLLSSIATPYNNRKQCILITEWGRYRQDDGEDKQTESHDEHENNTTFFSLYILYVYLTKKGSWIVNLLESWIHNKTKSEGWGETARKRAKGRKAFDEAEKTSMRQKRARERRGRERERRRMQAYFTPLIGGDMEVSPGCLLNNCPTDPVGTRLLFI